MNTLPHLCIKSCIFGALVLSGLSCLANQNFRGRLVKKGLCNMHVIEVVNTSLWNHNKHPIAATWIAPDNYKHYRNVFGLSHESRCHFPELAEGSSFFFSVQDEDASANVCMLCKAYSPIPLQTFTINIKLDC